MKKQEAIKRAWGKNWNEVKDLVDEDGSVLTFRFIEKEDPTEWELDEDLFWRVLGYKREQIFEIYDDMGPSRWYPKVLEGIENNNGWIRITAIDDIPKEVTECYVFDDDRDIGYYIFGINDNDFEHIIENGVTHYQVIIKPNPPIY